MRRAASWSESVVDCRALERVQEATGLSDVEAQDRVRVAMGSWGGEQGGGTLGVVPDLVEVWVLSELPVL